MLQVPWGEAVRANGCQIFRRLDRSDRILDDKRREGAVEWMGSVQIPKNATCVFSGGCGRGVLSCEAIANGTGAGERRSAKSNILVLGNRSTFPLKAAKKAPMTTRVGATVSFEDVGAPPVPAVTPQLDIYLLGQPGNIRI